MKSCSVEILVLYVWWLSCSATLMLCFCILIHVWAHWWFCRQETNERRVIQFSAWDFAGQEIYYTTHQFFLSERSIFLVVWDTRLDNTAYGRIEFWLQSIRFGCGFIFLFAMCYYCCLFLFLLFFFLPVVAVHNSLLSLCTANGLHCKPQRLAMHYYCEHVRALIAKWQDTGWIELSRSIGRNSCRRQSISRKRGSKGKKEH